MLIPKKSNALRPEDYRPISLIHSAAKILGKLLANRVAPKLQDIISVSQSAFLKGRCIQDNFLYVQNTIQTMQRKKKQAIFLKLDIAKAFDSLSWDYLLDVLKHVGFSQRFRDLICIALATTSSRILLNGSRASLSSTVVDSSRETPYRHCSLFWPLIPSIGYCRRQLMMGI